METGPSPLSVLHGKTAADVRAGASSGDKDAMYLLAVCYQHGGGAGAVPSDDVQAAAWFRKAADKGHVDATFRLGVCYERGAGVPIDTTRSFQCFKRAAEAGHADAMNNLAAWYEAGRGNRAVNVLKTYLDAVRLGSVRAVANVHRLYTLGASRADPHCLYMLGNSFRDGEGVPQDNAQAAKYYALAVNGGSAAAAVQLARLYEHGRGVRRNLLKAFTLLSAAARVDASAASDAARLEEEIDIYHWTPEKVRAWMQANRFDDVAAALEPLSHFDGSMLSEVTDADLRDLVQGGTVAAFGTRKRFLGLVNALKRMSAAMTATRVASEAAAATAAEPRALQPEDKLLDVAMRTFAQEVTRAVTGAVADRIFDALAP